MKTEKHKDPLKKETKIGKNSSEVNYQLRVMFNLTNVSNSVT